MLGGDLQIAEVIRGDGGRQLAQLSRSSPQTQRATNTRRVWVVNVVTTESA